MRALRVVLIPLFVMFGIMPFFGDTVAAVGRSAENNADWVLVDELFGFAMAYAPAVCVEDVPPPLASSSPASGECWSAIRDAYDECTDDEPGGCGAAIVAAIVACRWWLCAGTCTVTYWPPGQETIDCILDNCANLLAAVP